MSTTTPNQGIVIPVGTDAADNPDAFVDMIAGVEGRLVQRYTSNADRTARNPTPATNEMSIVAGNTGYDRWTGLAWERVADTTMFQAWTAGTPVLTGTVNPTNYTSVSRWTKVGRLGVMIFQITAGAAFTPGTGTYAISLPFTAVLNTQTSGAVRLFDSSTGNAHLSARAALVSTTTLAMQVTTTFGGALTNVGATIPWTWAANDIMDGFIIAETAS